MVLPCDDVAHFLGHIHVGLLNVALYIAEGLIIGSPVTAFTEVAAEAQ